MIRVILTLAMALIPFQLSVAQSNVDDTALEIFSNVMSPFCQGRLLRDCPSPQAGELKDKMRAELASGKSKEQVLNEFFTNFGEAYRASPKNTGFGRAAWITPFIFVGVGGLLIYLWLRSNKQNEIPIEPQRKSPDISDEMKARIEREIGT